MKEKRIYVVIAETVDTPDTAVVPSGTVVQVPGRMAAQGGHALSRMKMHRMARSLFSGSAKAAKAIAYRPELITMADEKTTTIWKVCRDTKELNHVSQLLNRAKITWYNFEDENREVYGYWHPATALATEPVYPERIEGVLDYLPLWAP